MRKFDRARKGGRLYDQRRWKETSRAFLRDHPLCVVCQAKGLVVPATDTDHVVPHKGDLALFWSYTNLQALCHECHARKSMREFQDSQARFAKLPRVEVPPASEVVVVACHPTYDVTPLLEREAAGRPFDVVDEHAQAAQVEKVARGFASDEARKDARAWRNERLAYAPKRRASLLFVVVDLPKWQDRRELARRLGAKRIIVAVPHDESSCKNSLDSDFLRRYAGSMSEEAHRV